MISPSFVPSSPAAQLTGQQPGDGGLAALLAAATGKTGKPIATAGGFAGLFTLPGKAKASESSPEKLIAAAQGATAQGMMPMVVTPLPEPLVAEGNSVSGDPASDAPAINAGIAGPAMTMPPAAGAPQGIAARSPVGISPAVLPSTATPGQPIVATVGPNPAAPSNTPANLAAVPVAPATVAPQAPNEIASTLTTLAATDGLAPTPFPGNRPPSLPGNRPAPFPGNQATGSNSLASGESAAPARSASPAAPVATPFSSTGPATSPAAPQNHPVAAPQVAAAVPTGNPPAPQTATVAPASPAASQEAAGAPPTTSQLGFASTEGAITQSEDRAVDAGKRPSAKIARSATTHSPLAGSRGTSPENTPTNIRPSTSNKSHQPIGTDTAKQMENMAATLPTPRASTTEIGKESHSVSFSADIGSHNAPVALPHEPVPAARQVLGTLLKVIDQPNSPERSHVDLQFDFGHETLAVRVGFKGGEVHTVFQTSSAELRSSLAQQWHDFTAQQPEAARALANPVFTHTASSHLGWSQHDGSSGRHHAGAYDEPATGGSLPAGAETEVEAVATNSRPAPMHSGRQLLNTLA